MAFKIEDILAQLDPADDDLWTSDGLPRLDVVSELVGVKVSRAKLVEAAPNFTRETAYSALEDDDDEEDQDEEELDEDEDEDEEDEDEDELDPIIDPGEIDRVAPADGDQVHAEEDPEAILALRVQDVLSSYEGARAALDALEHRANRLMKVKREAEAVLEGTWKQAELVKRCIQRFERSGSKGSKGSEEIQNYLKRQHEAREQRTMRARAFLNAGTSQADVLRELKGKSPLDAAMGPRRAARGSQRPNRTLIG